MWVPWDTLKCPLLASGAQSQNRGSRASCNRRASRRARGSGVHCVSEVPGSDSAKILRFQVPVPLVSDPQAAVTYPLHARQVPGSGSMDPTEPRHDQIVVAAAGAMPAARRSCGGSRTAAHARARLLELPAAQPASPRRAAAARGRAPPATHRPLSRAATRRPA